MLDSIVNSTVDGYDFIAMSESWKKLCLQLPDSLRVKIPPLYRTQIVEVTIGGQDLVIQAWRGDVLDPVRGLPGGIGGEVGIYKRDPTRTIPKLLDIPDLQLFAPFMRPLVRDAVSVILRDLVDLFDTGADPKTDLWWPDPIDVPIAMTFTNSTTGEQFFDAVPEPAGGYWMSRWMTYASFGRYAAQHATPTFAYEYRMDFAVGDQRYRWDAVDGPIVPR